MSEKISKTNQTDIDNAAMLDAAVDSTRLIENLDDFLREDDFLASMSYWLRNFEEQSIVQQFTTTDSIKHCINRSISEIDYLINEQVNEIIHNKRFQELESGWRGLWYLVSQSEKSSNLKIKMLDINWKEVSRDINRALEFDQSLLFKKIYSDEYGTPGGEPYGVILGNYEITHRTRPGQTYDDISTLKGLTEIAAASFSPFIAGGSNQIFGIESFSDLNTSLDLKTIFKQKEYIRWQSLRESSDSRFVGLTLPRVLMRKPYPTQPHSFKGVYFFEKSFDNQEFNLWGNACFAFGAILIREFNNVGWFGHIRGVPRDQIGGGLVTNLPLDEFTTDSPELIQKPSTEVIITDTAERELGNLGFIPLCKSYDTPFSAFYGNQSIQEPQHQGKTKTSRFVMSFDSVNAKISSMLQHVLCASRIAHYIKVIIRDKVGSFVSAQSCEDLLRNWLFKYTSGRDDLEWEEQARYPLRQSEVIVKERPDDPGKYICSIRLVPHYQVDQMVSELELVTELVNSAA